jgi:hypothetical protein
MIALEAVIEQKLEELIPAVSAHAGVTTLLTGFLAMTQAQRQALETRLKTIADNVPISKGTTKVLPMDSLSQGVDYPVSTALQIVYTMFHQAVIGYAVLHPLSTRFLDSPYIADEGTSYHLTHQHTENYVQAIQQICVDSRSGLWNWTKKVLNVNALAFPVELGFASVHMRAELL